MKPPFTYYGGKQRIASRIVPHIPRHTVYAEPFCGGATILFAKKTPKITNINHYTEIINDSDELVTSFFRVMSTPDKATQLISFLESEIYSQTLHREYLKKYRCNEPMDEIERAAMFFILTQMSFSCQFAGGFRYSKKARHEAITYRAKVEALVDYRQRIKYLCVFNEDALTFMKRFDSPQTFFYCDPPYPNTSQVYTHKYTLAQYQELIDFLSSCKASFILSCYRQGCEPSEWDCLDIPTRLAGTIHKRPKRTETIWVVDRGGGIEQDYFREIYSRPEFVEIWGLPLR